MPAPKARGVSTIGMALSFSRSSRKRRASTGSVSNTSTSGRSLSSFLSSFFWDVDTSIFHSSCDGRVSPFVSSSLANAFAGLLRSVIKPTRVMQRRCSSRRSNTLATSSGAESKYNNGKVAPSAFFVSSAVCTSSGAITACTPSAGSCLQVAAACFLSAMLRHSSSTLTSPLLLIASTARFAPRTKALWGESSLPMTAMRSGSCGAATIAARRSGMASMGWRVGTTGADLSHAPHDNNARTASRHATTAILGKSGVRTATSSVAELVVSVPGTVLTVFVVDSSNAKPPPHRARPCATCICRDLPRAQLAGLPRPKARWRLPRCQATADVE